MRNRLADATSPYLLQHRDNPVHWQPWDEPALAAAREQDKPILLSIGYAACHWCHVMAHESFENPEIAAQMNRDFINIKVDREERPDLDQIYQHALALLGQQGGWPLTMFLTPAGEPFWGGTYFPPESRYGRPGLPEVLQGVGQIWREERHKVTSNTSALGEALRRLARPDAGGPLAKGFAFRAATRLAQAFDTIHGGLSGAPKFPQTTLLDFLWGQARASGDATMRHAVIHTLTNICQGGIYDHLGGGFARYSVDALWLVPHFEKMLYDNAQLLGLLADVSADTRSPLFAARARETVGWLEREMLVEDAFASSLDADSEGEEGRYYVWQAAEIDRVLGADAPAFRLAYGVTEGGNWEGKTVLNRLHQQALLAPEQEAALRSSADRLLAVRAERAPPGRDDKVLADWNGPMIVALVKGAAVFDEPSWLQRAERAFAFITEHMQQHGRLAHSWRAGRTLDLAFLEDYAQMAAAALTLFEHTGKQAYREQAEAWLRVLDQDYLDPEQGGYFQAPASASDLVVRPKNAQDGPLPSGNGLLVGVLARLHYLTGAPVWRERAERQIAAFSGEAAHNPLGHAAMLSGAMLLEHPVQVVLVGEPASPELAALRRTSLAASLPEAVVLQIAPDMALPAGHPAFGKGQVDGRATAYVCPGQTCLAPVMEPLDLAASLASASLRTT
jgi:uncharacterized protein YyaL (SSP411 family)